METTQPSGTLAVEPTDPSVAIVESRFRTVDLNTLLNKPEQPLFLSVAGCAVKILFDPSWATEIRELCAEYWHAFTIEPMKTEIEIVLSAAAGKCVDIGNDLWSSPQPFQFKVEDRTGHWVFHRDFTSVRRNGKEGVRIYAWLARPRPGFFDALDNILAVSIRELMEKRSAFLFHSAVVEHGGQAVVFFGPSGIGKSTLAKLSSDRGLRIMASDQVYLRIEGENLVASASPTCNPDIQRTGDVWVTESLRVKALFALKRTGQLVVEQVDPAEMTRRLLSEIFHDETEADLALAFGFACKAMALKDLQRASLSYPIGFNFWPSLENMGII